MAVSYADIFADVCARLDNDLEPKSTSFEGDGVAQVLHLPDRNVCTGVGSPIVWLVSDDSPPVETPFYEDVDFTLDYQSGYLTLVDPVPSGSTLNVDYRVRHWNDLLLWRIINSGLSYLYPNFYAIVELTPTADDDGDYPLEDAEGRVIAGVIGVDDVDSSGGTIYRLHPNSNYQVVRKEAEAAYLRLFVSAIGTIKVRCAVHPTEFPGTGTTLDELGLPDRMREPLVLYACWQALTQKMPARSRWDNVTTANMESKTTFFDHARMVSMFKALLDSELQKNHMRPWTARGI